MDPKVLVPLVINRVATTMKEQLTDWDLAQRDKGAANGLRYGATW